ncbi:DUF1194 domain-containing protein [Ruegeria profundi]|uniref:DUF1194 domain-containing protein n=1 Tax=Ruegeria profundi TaxID=1685378 RepID=UPI00384AA840
MLFILLGLPALSEEVELELVLLADASGSITEAEIEFQRQGYADAITDPRVLAAMQESAYGAIAVTYVEWAANTAVVVDWTKIDGAKSAQVFADALIGPPRQAYGRNAIGAALLDAKRLIEENDFEGWRKVIDFSGDSPNSFSGPAISTAREKVVASGITINGLPILCRFCDTPARYPDLAKIYEQRIIGGIGAFVVTAANEDDLAEAIRRKLILEISGLEPPKYVASK